MIVMLICCLVFADFAICQSQDSKYNYQMPVNQSTLLGVGKVSMLDSYLSPLVYDGISFSLLHERMRNFYWRDTNMLLQSQFVMHLGSTKNPTSTSSEYRGNVEWGINGYYPIVDEQKFRLYVGGGPEASLGGIYNVRNSNNPGSLKTYINVNAGALAMYNWKKITFRWQVSTPFVGMVFSPGYGHSYYEIFTLGNDKGTLHIASFGSQLAFRNYVTADIPVDKVTFRIGYLCDIYRTNLSKIETKINTHEFVIGLAFETLNFGGKRDIEKSKLNSSLYRY